MLIIEDPANRLLSKKNIIGLLLSGIIILAIPLGVFLAKNTQLFRSRAGTGSGMTFLAADGTTLPNDTSDNSLQVSSSKSIKILLAPPEETAPKKYKCVNNACAEAIDGTYTESTCNNTCVAAPKKYKCVNNACTEASDGTFPTSACGTGCSTTTPPDKKYKCVNNACTEATDGTFPTSACGTGCGTTTPPAGSERYKAYEAFSYKSGNDTYAAQSLIAENGKDSWYRACKVNATGNSFTFSGCSSSWSPIDLTNAVSGNSQPFRSYGAYSYEVENKTYVVQSLVADDGVSSWFRTCQILVNEQTPNQFSFGDTCSSWSPVNLSGIVSGISSFRGYEAFSFKNGNNTYVAQSLIADNGTDSWFRTCKVNHGGTPILINCGDFADNPIPLGSAISGNSQPFRSYGAFHYESGGATYAVQSLLAYDGFSSWYRSCPVTITEGNNITFDASKCTGWTAVPLNNIRRSSSSSIGSNVAGVSAAVKEVKKQDESKGLLEQILDLWNSIFSYKGRSVVENAYAQSCGGSTFSCDGITCPDGSTPPGTGCYETGGDPNNRWRTECLSNCPGGGGGGKQQGEDCSLASDTSPVSGTAGGAPATLYCRGFDGGQPVWISQGTAVQKCKDGVHKTAQIPGGGTYYCNGTTWVSTPPANGGGDSVTLNTSCANDKGKCSYNGGQGSYTHWCSSKPAPCEGKSYNGGNLFCYTQNASDCSGGGGAGTPPAPATGCVEAGKCGGVGKTYYRKDGIDYSTSSCSAGSRIILADFCTSGATPPQPPANPANPPANPANPPAQPGQPGQPAAPGAGAGAGAGTGGTTVSPPKSYKVVEGNKADLDTAKAVSGNFSGANATVDFTLSDGEGVKVIWVRYEYQNGTKKEYSDRVKYTTVTTPPPGVEWSISDASCVRDTDPDNENGTKITITGQNLGTDLDLANGKVMYGEERAKLLPGQWKDGQIVATITKQLTGDNYVKVYKANDNKYAHKICTASKAPAAKITGVTCSVDPDNLTGTKITITGQSFEDGLDQKNGKVEVGSTTATIAPGEWQDTRIIAKLSTQPQTPQYVRVVKGTKKSDPVICTVGVTQLDFRAALACRGVAKPLAEASLEVRDASSSAAIYKNAKVTFDSEGRAQNVTPKLDRNTAYKLAVKASLSVRRVIPFTTGTESTSAVDAFDLPLGDITPTGGDGVINSLDVSELKRQWKVIDTGTSSKRTADFNGDGLVNSIDYSCIVSNYNHSSDP